MTNDAKNNVATSNSTLQDALVFNNRKANVRMTAEQLGAERFDSWKRLIDNLHRNAYTCYEKAENAGLKTSDASIDKTAIADGLRAIYAEIGAVNERPLLVNDATLTLIIGYAGKRGNDDALELKALTQTINAKKALLRAAKDTAGIDAKYISDLEDGIANDEDKKKVLLDTPDMRVKAPTMTSGNAFRLDIEHLIARGISEQKCKTLEEIDAEIAKRKEERAARNKAKRAAKKEAEAKAKAEAETSAN